ncbi:hypothetical protein ACLIBG_06510 [Virgibacillus sp. W0181]|uniref:hypothetical protein n=1 Tax=Virgibacillus sp. W0181 TaxID=3391581 RepID=UPI003F44A9D5
MKNQSPFTNRESGFYLPYVLFIITIIFIVITASIQVYSNDIQMTRKHLEQLKIETLFQISRTKLKEDIKNNSPSIRNKDHVIYVLPEGTVTINFMPLEVNTFQLHFTILTDENTTYTLTNKLKINDENKLNST